MMTAPRFSSHEEQKAVRGCAADLNPEIHPRRFALHQARLKSGARANAETIPYRERRAKEGFAARAALAERAKWYSDLTGREAAKQLGISYDTLRKLKTEFALVFKRGAPGTDDTD